MTEAESFLWYRPESRLQIGVAYLWKQEAFRALASYVVIPEKADSPALKIGAGVQGISTGNPGYFATVEKSFHAKDFRIHAYSGMAFRANESHSHGIGGVKLSFHNPWSVGLQLDGHDAHPYVTFDTGPVVAGFYWAGMKRPGYLLGLRW